MLIFKSILKMCFVCFSPFLQFYPIEIEFGFRIHLHEIGSHRVTVDLQFNLY